MSAWTNEELDDFVTRAAVAVSGTEAIAYRLEGVPPLLMLATHIRPDDAEPKVRFAAIKAFRGMILQCVAASQDGCLCVGTPDESMPQHCLIRLLRSRGVVDAAIAIVVRCRPEEAPQRLEVMQQVD